MNAATHPPIREDVLASIGPTMGAFAARHGIPGIATRLIWRGRVIHTAYAGWQDGARTRPLSPGTIYRIYSMTKPVVCAGLMQLWESGQVRLDDMVADYIPGFSDLRVLEGSGALVPAGRSLHIWDLLTHTAGLTYDFLEDNPVSALYREARLMADATRPLGQMVTELSQLPLAFQPGVRWHYSLAMDVLAHLIEIISGQPLEDFLRQRFFIPLDMGDTGFSVPPSQLHRLAEMSGCPDVAVSTLSQSLAAQAAGDIQVRDVETTYPAQPTACFARGGHGLFSSLEDYARFAAMLLNEGELEGSRVLLPDTVRLMRSSQVPPASLPVAIGPEPHAGYGFGLGVRVRLNASDCAFPGANGEFGWEGAARTSFWVDQKHGLAGVLMMQHMVGRDWPEREFRELAYQALAR
ncbi:MAG: serine hydrolase domain-containing protein [Pseudomonadota bacterium]